MIRRTDPVIPLECSQQQGDYDYYPVLHFYKGNGDVPRLLVVIEFFSLTSLA